MAIDSDTVLQLLEKNGPIARFLKGFEARDGQKKMLLEVLKAYNEGHVALIEAGTGTGKSLAYLIPALLFAAQRGKRTVISTNTINLQEQLLQKDIPFLLDALGLELKVRLVKGMGNYLCLRKLKDVSERGWDADENKKNQLRQLEEWAQLTADGSRAKLPFLPERAVWELAHAEPDLCPWRRCLQFGSCFFAKARQDAADAQILVVNHHLLFADIVRRAEEDNYQDQAILPPYDHLILDEAHHIEEIAMHYFARRVSRIDAARLLARLASEKTGKLPELNKRLGFFYLRKYKELPEPLRPLCACLGIQLPEKRKSLIHSFANLFQCYAEWLDLKPSEEESEEGFAKARLCKEHLLSAHWRSTILPFTELLAPSIQEYTFTIQELIEKLRKENAFCEQHQGLLHDIGALNRRLAALGASVKEMVHKEFTLDRVRWIEMQPAPSGSNVTLVNAYLNIADLLRKHLFNCFRSVVLCSATLSTDEDFSFLRARLGLNKPLDGDRQVRTSIHGSPFDYCKQALLAIANDLPLPSDPRFAQAAALEIRKALEASRGNALVLFTSYRLLRHCYDALKHPLADAGYPLFTQGDTPRHRLLEQFRKAKRSVLFATYSFWEGVDIAGDDLRCVIIVKLPFKVPSEPLMQARCEALAEQGGDPFFDYALPLAIIKFKQGFGRLIRSRSDSGCILCLDVRLAKKAYGKKILRSLPPCQLCIGPKEEVRKAVKSFYLSSKNLSQ